MMFLLVISNIPSLWNLYKAVTLQKSTDYEYTLKCHLKFLFQKLFEFISIQPTTDFISYIAKG